MLRLGFFVVSQSLRHISLPEPFSGRTILNHGERNFSNLPAEEPIVLSFVKKSIDIDFRGLVLCDFWSGSGYGWGVTIA